MSDFIAFYLTSPFEDEALLTTLYVQNKLSAAQIAERLSCSPSTVKQRLKKAGVPLRKPRHHHGNPSQPRFGFRVINGREIPHEGEQRVIRTVRDLRREKLTLRQIADLLTQMGVPTKRRGKGWHPEMISRILQQT